MRLHRGSSKDARGRPPATGNLPLSASPRKIRVEVEVVRGGGSRRARFSVEPGTLVRAVVKLAGEAPEGCAVLIGETPVPLDTAIERPLRLTVVPTFSGG
jgi:sulfur carrier protein ThiS